MWRNNQLLSLLCVEKARRMDPRAASPSADALKGAASSDEEAEKDEGLIEIAEGNVVSACSVFVASVVLDALNALPSTIVVDVPTSLRTTALVLIALVAVTMKILHAACCVVRCNGACCRCCRA